MAVTPSPDGIMDKVVTKMARIKKVATNPPTNQSHHCCLPDSPRPSLLSVVDMILTQSAARSGNSLGKCPSFTAHITREAARSCRRVCSARKWLEASAIPYHQLAWRLIRACLAKNQPPHSPALRHFVMLLSILAKALLERLVIVLSHHIAILIGNINVEVLNWTGR